MMPTKIVAAAGKVLNYGEFELQIHIYGTYGRYCVFTRVIVINTVTTESHHNLIP
jgi:hypothetical protein